MRKTFYNDAGRDFRIEIADVKARVYIVGDGAHSTNLCKRAR